MGDSGRQLVLMLGREHEVVTPRHRQRRRRDLAEAVHDLPALEQVAASEDQRLRPQFRAPLATDQIADSQPQAGVVGVRARADPGTDNASSHRN